MKLSTKWHDFTFQLIDGINSHVGANNTLWLMY